MPCIDYSHLYVVNLNFKVDNISISIKVLLLDWLKLNLILLLDQLRLAKRDERWW